MNEYQVSKRLPNYVQLDQIFNTVYARQLDLSLNGSCRNDIQYTKQANDVSSGS